MWNRRRGGLGPYRHGGAVLAAWALCLLFATPAAASHSPSFSTWLEDLRREALDRGISHATVAMALTDVEPLPRVLELDRSQPKRPTEFCDYIRLRLTSTRIERARRILEEHRELLRELHQEYGIPPRYLVAVWGLESNFGDYMGEFPVIPALATLAHDPRRSELFREQLLAALQIVDQGHLEPHAFLGSWAGATGNVQFMPTTFLDYAVDHDGDGRKNIWSSVPDSLASAANYMDRSGWRRGQSWGRRVRLPEGMNGRALPGSRPLGEWQRLGVRRLDGRDLPRANLRASLVLPLRSSNPAFLVYGNYRTFLTWNQSTFFAISLGALADRVERQGSSRVCAR